MTNERVTGLALAVGSVSFLTANTVLTLLMPIEASTPDLFASNAYLARLSVAAAAVFFLLIGAIGIFNRVGPQMRRFGIVAFAVTFTGSLFMFAHEWGQVFFLHQLAKLAPEGLIALDDSPGINLYHIEPFLGLALFLLGWILLAIAMLISPTFKSAGPILLLSGILAVPLFAANLPGLWGFVVGNSVVGVGWLLVARDLLRLQQTSV